MLVFDGTSDGTQSSKINTSVFCGAVGKKTGCGKYGSTVTKQYAGSRGAVVGYSYNAIEIFTGVGRGCVGPSKNRADLCPWGCQPQNCLSVLSPPQKLP